MRKKNALWRINVESEDAEFSQLLVNVDFVVRMIRLFLGFLRLYDFQTLVELAGLVAGNGVVARIGFHGGEGREEPEAAYVRSQSGARRQVYATLPYATSST